MQKEAHTQTVICTMRITLRSHVLSERSSCPKYGSNQRINPDVEVLFMISSAITAEGNDVVSVLLRTLTPIISFSFIKFFSQKMPKIIPDKERTGHMIGKSDSEAEPPRSRQV